jgi:hypothetical protein
MKQIIIFTSLIFVLFTSCIINKNTFDNQSKINSLGQPLKIEYYKHIQGQAFMLNKIPEFSIIEKSEIEKIINEIRMADNPKPFKGAGWDRIIITYSDTILKINTDKEKIGYKANGIFYELNRNNFITERISE